MVNETIELDVEKLQFPKNEAERTDRWRKRLKYMTLTKYADLLEDRTKSKEKKDYKFKADST